MKIGSLFSGVGLLDLGLEVAGVGETVWQVEQNEFCRKVLERHFPRADRSVRDVRLATPSSLALVDVLCGGFPCQGNSSAGKGLGLKDPRSALWYEFARCVGEFKPKWVVVENVTSGKRRWLPHVRRDLHVLGYRTRAFDLSAADVGAPHLRRRVFVLAAHPERVELREQHRWRGGSGGEGETQPSVDGEPREASGVGDALRSGLERTDWKANEGRPESSARGKGAGTLADTNGEGQLQQSGPDSEERRWARYSGYKGWRNWSFEPDVGRVAHGVPSRVDRLTALGNAVVPQCAEVIGRLLLDLIVT